MFQAQGRPQPAGHAGPQAPQPLAQGQNAGAPPLQPSSVNQGTTFNNPPQSGPGNAGHHGAYATAQGPRVVPPAPRESTVNQGCNINNYYAPVTYNEPVHNHYSSEGRNSQYSGVDRPSTTTQQQSPSLVSHNPGNGVPATNPPHTAAPNTAAAKDVDPLAGLMTFNAAGTQLGPAGSVAVRPGRPPTHPQSQPAVSEEPTRKRTRKNTGAE